MKNILQQLEALVTNFNKKDQFRKAHIKLTLLYIFYISIILFVVSFAVYWLFINNLNLNSIFPDTALLDIQNHIDQEFYKNEKYIHELKEKLQQIIILIDLGIIIISGFIAYLFAEKTLQPIQKILTKHKQFSSDVAHELRTPLSILKSGIEYTLLKERNKQEYQKLLKEQLEEIEYLINVSNDLLLSTDINNENNVLKRINISKLCENQYNLMGKYFTQKNILFTKNISSNIFVQADEIKLKRALYNLLKNAGEYSQKKTSVNIKLYKEGRFCHISISDTGIGIAKENKEKIFQQFYKVDKARK